ncbi:hypothetical protein Bca52824_028640 [Brassica carinata]|uniref:Uncharacterized protein n=1 Tax=Brassica carinata TaxID=52824 RepID=A0A8X8ARX8_BRACI|nr:hypothetical protein Bca52824_028640 [Brassica carinata]
MNLEISRVHNQLSDFFTCITRNLCLCCVRDFVKDAGAGGKGNLPMNRTPEIVKTRAWDGKDGEVMGGR